MAIRRRTTGDMCNLGAMAESEYGTPTGKPVYCGTLRTLSDKTAIQREDIVECGQRSKTSMPTGYATGFSANMVIRGSADEQMAILKGWLTKAMGIEPGIMEYYPAAEIPSFTATAKVGPGEHQIWTGSKVDTLTLSQSAPGALIQMQVEAMSKWHTFTDAENEPIDEDGDVMTLADLGVASPSGPPMNYARLAYFETELRAQSWTLSISNSLEGDADASELYGSLSAGKDSTPTGSEITLEVTVPSMASSELEILRRDKCREFDDDNPVVVAFGSFAIVLRDVIVDPAGPDRTSESAYSEKVKITARGLYITKVGA
jgi:hypothetical protein